jgi:hypothetical protein
VKILAVGFSLRLEEGSGTIEETEIERMLRPGRHLLDVVKRELVRDVFVASCHRALVDQVIDPTEYAIGRCLPLG